MLRLIGMSKPGRTPSIPELMPAVPPKLVERKLEKLADQGLIEFGTVITRPWLTDKGREAIR
jgi:hypothetical protein